LLLLSLLSLLLFLVIVVVLIIVVVAALVTIIVAGHNCLLSCFAFLLMVYVEQYRFRRRRPKFRVH
jgi:uncharacterized membrane protein